MGMGNKLEGNVFNCLFDFLTSGGVWCFVESNETVNDRNLF